MIQEDRLSLECAAKEYLRRMSVIWTSPLSDHNRVTASNQSRRAAAVELLDVDTTLALGGTAKK